MTATHFGAIDQWAAERGLLPRGEVTPGRRREDLERMKGLRTRASVLGYRFEHVNHSRPRAKWRLYDEGRLLTSGVVDLLERFIAGAEEANGAS
jgi:hypothetical protein